MRNLLYNPTLTSIHKYCKNHSFDYMDLCWESNVLAFYTLCRFVIAFSPRSKCVLTSWLQSPSALILEPKKIKPVTVSIVSSIICHEVMWREAMILLFECWVLSQLFHSLSFSSRGSLVPLSFLPWGWCRLHIWGIGISPSNHDSSLCFIQPHILHDVLAYKLNKQGDNIQS